MKDLAFLTKALEHQQDKGLLRRLSLSSGSIDFGSNDYLGFARSPELNVLIEERWQEHSLKWSGSTGSRLLSGNTVLHEEIERELAQFYQAPTALLFNSGYDANLALLASLPSKESMVIYDEWVHASIWDGLRLSRAQSVPFRHNDLNHLRRRLQRGTPPFFVVVESIYSMDGDMAPLEEIVELCTEFGAHLLVDEAHASGVVGKHGEGRVVTLGLADEVLARVHTFGKALGVHGAVVVTRPLVKDYLINFARPWIYTTALPPHSLIAVQCAHEFLGLASSQNRQLNENIACFLDHAQNTPQWDFLPSQSPIQGILAPGHSFARQLAVSLQQKGFSIWPILSPTVPRGKERLRVCLHAHNTPQEIQQLFYELRCIQR